MIFEREVVPVALGFRNALVGGHVADLVGVLAVVVADATCDDS